MASLRELRTQATELGLVFEKTTNAVELQDLILTKMCELEMETGAPPAPPKASTAPAPVRTPVPAAPEAAAGKTPPAESFGSSMEINEGDLNAEFKRQAALYNTFATAEAIAKAKTLTAKLRVEVVHSEQFKKFRTQYIEAGEKPTEKMIESEISTSLEYQAAQRLLIEAVQNEAIAKGAKESFSQRKDMLIQLGSSKRQEIDQIGMNVRETAKKIMAA